MSQWVVCLEKGCHREGEPFVVWEAIDVEEDFASTRKQKKRERGAAFSGGSNSRPPNVLMKRIHDRAVPLVRGTEGSAGFDLSIPGKSFWLLSRCKVPSSAWTNIFMQARTTNSFFPTTEDEVSRLKSTLRMNSHMHESGPHNIIQLANRGHSAQGATYAVSVYDGSSTSVGAESLYYATDNMSYAYPSDWSSAPETHTVCEMCNSSEAYSLLNKIITSSASSFHPSLKSPFCSAVNICFRSPSKNLNLSSTRAS